MTVKLDWAAKATNRSEPIWRIIMQASNGDVEEASCQKLTFAEAASVAYEKVNYLNSDKTLFWEITSVEMLIR